MALSDNGCETLTGWAWIPGSCTVVYTDEAGVPNPIDFGEVLESKLVAPEPSTFDYLPNSHTVVHNGNPFPLNCGELNFDLATCQLSYVNEKGQPVSWFIPQDAFTHNQAANTLTIQPAKGGTPLVLPLGVPASQVGIALIDNKILEFTYLDKKCAIPMPNSVVGCQYDQLTNTLTMIYCDGSSQPKALPKASLQINTLPDGSQVVVFNDGCSPNNTVFSIPGVVVDVDDATLIADVLTLTFNNESGGTNVVTVPLCQIIATHCNATITAQYPGGGFDFIDNGLNTFQIRPCCGYHDIGLSYQADGPNVPPTIAKAAGANDGDRLTVKYPANESGVAAIGYYSCVNGLWAEDFLCPLGTPTRPEVHIGAVQPNKDDGFTVWFNPDTCALRLCDGADGWFTPTSVVCSEATPACVKGGPTLWFDPATGCLSVQCEDDSGTCLWLSATGTIVNQVIEALCLQIGDTAPVDLQVGANGKVIIPIPAYPEFPEPEPGCCHYNTESNQNIVLGENITAPSGTAAKNPGDTVVQKHPNGVTAWTCGATGWTLDWACPFPTAELPPLLKCGGSDQPALDGSEGIFWFDDSGCLHVLCQGIWHGTNGIDVATV